MKPNYTQLIDAIVTLCRAEKAAAYYQDLFTGCNGYEDTITCLEQLIARCDNPVIRMLAKQAINHR